MSLEAEKAEVQALIKRLDECRTQITETTTVITTLLAQANESGQREKVIGALQDNRKPQPADLSTETQFRLESLKKRLFIAQAREVDLKEQVATFLNEHTELLPELSSLIEDTKRLRSAIES